MSQVMLIVIAACVAGPAVVRGQLEATPTQAPPPPLVDSDASWVCTEPIVGESFVAELVVPDGTTTDLDHPHRCVGPVRARTNKRHRTCISICS